MPDINSAIEKFKNVMEVQETYVNSTTEIPIAAIESTTDSDEVECSKCHTKLATDSRFCSKCGHKIEVKKTSFCTQCGESINIGFKFCSNCGIKILQR